MSSQPFDINEALLSRRALGIAGIAALLAHGDSRAKPGDIAADVAAPKVSFVFEAIIAIGAAVDLGTAEGITHRFVPVTGGTISGPRFRGTVLEGGNDTQRVHADGLTEIYARSLWKADDGAIIQVLNRGVRRGPAEVLKRMAAGSYVDPSLYYMRMTTTFEAAASRYAWLEQSVFVCMGSRREDGRSSLRFFEVL
jgi:hypothetical protein